MEDIVRELDEIDKRLAKAAERLERYWVHEFFPHRCQFCKNAVATSYALKRHIATSKKCKQIREESCK